MFAIQLEDVAERLRAASERAKSLGAEVLVDPVNLTFQTGAPHQVGHLAFEVVPVSDVFKPGEDKLAKALDRLEKSKAFVADLAA